MARNDSASPAVVRGSSWRGRERNDDQARHRWQRAGDGSVGRGRRWWRRSMLAILLCAVPLLLGFLVYQLLFAPARTWIATIAVAGHAAPISPHGWTHEDVLGLKELDGETIRLVDCSQAWTTKNQALAHLRAQLKSGGGGRRPPALVLYFSLPGTVNESGEPCLLLPDADPFDSESWLTIQDVLSVVKDTRSATRLPKLIVLDTVRELVDWKTGLVCNTFAERIAEATKRAAIPNLAVMTSAGPGERSHTAAELHGSVFGTFFRLGLAGAADRREHGGNGDRQVTLQELHRYLRRETDGWTRRFIGERQLPGLTPDTIEFMVSWSQQPATVEQWEQQTLRMEPAALAVTSAELSQLWKRRDQLAAHHLGRFDPWSWGRLQHDLLRLEKEATAGEAYRDAATQLAADIKRRLEAAEQRVSAAESAGNQFAAAAAFTGIDGLSPLPWRVHSLPLAEMVGVVSPSQTRVLADQWDQVRQLPTDVTSADTLKAFSPEEIGQHLVEPAFLHRVSRRNVAALWADIVPIRDALATRALAETSAALRFGTASNSDERVLPWVSSRLRNADRLRLAAEDQLFLGQEASGNNPIGLFQPAQDAYAEANALGERVAAAFQIRDECREKLPFLAAWLIRPTNAIEAADQSTREPQRTLTPLLESLRRLEAALEREEHGATIGESPDWDSDELVASIELRLRRVEQVFRQDIEKLRSETQTTAEIVRRIDAVLGTPLPTWDIREGLTQQRRGVISELSAAPKTAEVKEPSEVEQNGDDVVQRLMETSHPLALILLRDSSVATDEAGDAPAADHTTATVMAAVQKAESLSARLRRRFREIAELRDFAAEHDAPSARTAASIAKPWRLLDACRTAAAVRAASPLWLSDLPDDPVRRLRAYDWQQLVIFQAERCLEDFYGGDSRRDEPFFSRAAGNYLKLAHALAVPSTQVVKQIEEQTQLLSQRNLAAREAVTVAAADLLLVDHSPEVETEVEIRPGDVEARDGLPLGEMAVFVSDKLGRLGSQARGLSTDAVRRETTAMPAKWATEWSSRSVAERGPFLEATADFRGNEFVAPLFLRAAGGTQVIAKHLNYGPARVTVFGHERRKASIMIILDCSHSMDELTQTESPDGGDTPRISRMESARRALRSLLAELADRGDTWVGVRFFGHRVAWSTTEPNKLLRQNRYAVEIPPDLRPHSDVELVLPLGRFDPSALGTVLDKLKTVEPWGETPLYFALTQAVQDFAADEEEGEKAVIVITDGLNYQFNAPAEKSKSRNDVVSLGKTANVPITIVGFDLAEREAAEAEREFLAITKDTGGRFVPVAGATQLSKSLKSLLKVSTYRLADADGEAAEEAEIGGSLTVAVPHDGRRLLRLSYQAARQTLPLFGGENAELSISRDGTRFEVAPFTKGTPRFISAVAPRGERGWQAGIHRPIRDEDNVVFPISVQSSERRFTPRPSDMWVEITPRTVGGNVRRLKYIFYDPTFEPDTTVPVWNCTARGWPRDVVEAEVQVWFKFGHTPPATVIPLGEVADRTPAIGSGHLVECQPGVTFQARTVRTESGLVIGVVERHGSASPGVNALRLSLNPPPQKMEHRFDEDNRVVMHTFEYTDDDVPAVESIDVQFTPRSAVLEDSYQLRDPEVVRISATADLLPLSPPGN